MKTEPPATPCECANWCCLDHRVAFLTNHHPNCPKGGNPLEAAFTLIKELTRGIECWAAEEDGEVYADLWKPYIKAKALEGVFIPEDTPTAEPSRPAYRPGPAWLASGWRRLSRRAAAGILADDIRRSARIEYRAQAARRRAAQPATGGPAQ